MSPRATVPLTSDISAALAMFFHKGLGPSHTVVSRVLTGTGYGDGYTYDPDVQGPNKEQRVLQALTRAQREPARSRDLVAELRSFCGPYSGALVTVNGGAVFGLVDDLLALSCAMMGDVTGEQRHARSAARVRQTAQVPTALSERI